MDAVIGYEHGWQACRRCHSPSAEVTQDRDWALRANPGYWGSRAPKVLVLGFSKGANQLREAQFGGFDGVAFARMRPRISEVLLLLGLADEHAAIDQRLSASSQDLGAASLLRCGLSLMVNGKPITSGPVIAKAMKDPWTTARIQECIRQHLPDMPASVQTVVLLGNDDRYVVAVKAMIRAQFPDYREGNAMSFTARDATWVFAAHPSPLNGHFSSWTEGGTGVQGEKLRLSQAALAIAAPPVPVHVPASIKASPLPRPTMTTALTVKRASRADRYAKTFRMVGTRGEAIYPILITGKESGVTSFKLAKRGTGTHTTDHTIEVEDEEKAYQMVASGTYKIRAIRATDKAPSLLGVGDAAVREVIRVK